ncbi:MAG: nucleotidyltransferase domain-containing protein [Betaproteobacteria bacterium]|nr:nucleotidyltransferase domain-containing protein [Betaproteobacteria bacterium]MBK8107144.1 nucleotidyltransferase domain-containing protein [Betaproteobacteria bacterium]
MRLSPDQVHAIVAATQELAGADARVRLFGSRVNDQLRGGDIDLLVECARPVARPVWLAAQITARLQRSLGERKIDVLVVDPTTELETVHRVARAEGLLLQP